MTLAVAQRSIGRTTRVDARGSPSESLVTRQETQPGDLGQCDVFGVIGLGPAERGRDVPGRLRERWWLKAIDRRRGERPPRRAGQSFADHASVERLVQGGEGLRPQGWWGNERVFAQAVEPSCTGGHEDCGAGVEDQLLARRQCSARCWRIRPTQSGIGSPVAVSSHHAGAANTRAPATASRSSSSMTCWVPTFRAVSLPSRIHRRMVSGWRPVRLAASGTVNIVVAYYNTLLRRQPGHIRSAASPGPPRASRRAVRRAAARRASGEPR